ncbi:Protein of uncharacterised function DUF262 [Alysiella crassa]|uniref:Protein of uncharacterized function DUF262 n=2 Tax=Alysiella crassa TaxID=153491 RepID=A0A376BTF5_9NEIS|nr:DUF262 domain-containing protein [Alysiella crassa]UOP05789.1 DUF262 domain-containing protein [Alysiella crassa]UOP08114.1 DUF262 domain-containing protein [Alysiella crassa]SSY80199.1 Protein of uncharacterised function DUF262 [Alysiella crassa]
MKIEMTTITIRQLVENYQDNAENGVRAFGGKLDVRPPYQREFVYKDKQRDAVINTINKGFPLNVMYWAVRDDGTFEIVDGQQRTLSICQYVNGDFAYEMRYFHNLQPDEQEKFLNYELTVYQCTGSPSDKLDWFQTINIAGEKLTDQELRNAVYAGSWVTDAKRHFSKNGCVAYQIGKDYLNGSPIRQDFLETAIAWHANQSSDTAIRQYMAIHQHDKNADDLWLYFKNVIEWVNLKFPVKRAKLMKGQDWGFLYNRFQAANLDKDALESEIAKLIADDDVGNQRGIYPYVLTRDEKFLNIRAFSDSLKQKVFEKQKGICPNCKQKFELAEMEGDHITPWSEGGKTVEENCQMLCKPCNRRKSNK